MEHTSRFHENRVNTVVKQPSVDLWLGMYSTVPTHYEHDDNECGCPAIQLEITNAIIRIHGDVQGLTRLIQHLEILLTRMES
jgi:hypothetical protein